MAQPGGPRRMSLRLSVSRPPPAQTKSMGNWMCERMIYGYMYMYMYLYIYMCIYKYSGYVHCDKKNIMFV